MFRYFEPRDRFEATSKIPSSSEISPRVKHSESDVEPPLRPRNVPFTKGGYLETDPHKRTQILDYHPNDQDEIRRAYLLQGPTKPKLGKYPTRVIGGKNRSFVESWYDEFDWIEYSVKGNAVYCLPCYLFYNGSSRSAFVKEGFQAWNQKQKLNSHVGKKPNSIHKNCVKRCEDLLKKNQSIEHSYTKYSAKEEQDYLIRLKASLEAVKFLVKGGLAFRAHNEGENSVYKGHFREFVEVLGRNSEKIADAIASGSGNCKMTSPDIQKQLANACAVETINKIVKEIRDDIFCVLVDESGDTSNKEQMAVVIRFVDEKGFVVERFIGIVHVSNTSAKSLKEALETLLSGVVKINKKLFQQMRECGWERFYEKVASSCSNIEITVPDMDSRYVRSNKSSRLAPFISTLHHFKNDCFIHVIDLILKELNDRFTPENSELLHCITCLSPLSSFEAFDTKSLVRLARLYPRDFENVTDNELSGQLENYIQSVKMDDNFSKLKGISDLSKTLVRTKKHTTFRFVYRLVKLALTLPVATATVERVFSGLNYVKNEKRNKMANPWLNDCLVTFVEKEVFSTIDDMDIIKRFQAMTKRRMQLP